MLGSFGVEKKNLPVDDHGNVKSAEDWVEFRRNKEFLLHENNVAATGGTSVGTSPPSAVPRENGMLTPGPDDIVMGERTKESKTNPGNVYYRQLVEEKASEYNSTRSSKVKSELREYVIRKLRERGGRFLTREEGRGWREMKEEALIRKRVNQAFRNYRQRTEHSNG